jgi:hypothetical protein
MSALRTLVAMSAQRGGAATRYRVQHFDMGPVQPAPALFEEAGAASANHIRHLKRWRVHFLALFTLPRNSVEEVMGISSSGLATVFRCFRDRCK